MAMRLAQTRKITALRYPGLRFGRAGHDGQTARAAGRMAHRTHRVDRVRLQAYFLDYGNVQHGLQLIDAADQQRRVWTVQMLPVGQCSCYQMRAGRVTRGGPDNCMEDRKRVVTGERSIVLVERDV